MYGIERLEVFAAKICGHMKERGRLVSVRSCRSVNVRRCGPSHVIIRALYKGSERYWTLVAGGYKIDDGAGRIFDGEYSLRQAKSFVLNQMDLSHQWRYRGQPLKIKKEHRNASK